jgi:hypothetical protein
LKFFTNKSLKAFAICSGSVTFSPLILKTLADGKLCFSTSQQRQKKSTKEKHTQNNNWSISKIVSPQKLQT